MYTRTTTRIQTYSALLTLFILSSTSLGGPPYVNDGFDATKTLGFEQCQKCHAEQVTVLKQHAHYSHARALQRDPAAIQMAKAIGGSSVKRTARCFRCHYTTQAAYEPGQTTGSQKAISPISCESCHGPSRDWILAHNDYGGPTVTKENESPDHRQSRIEKSTRLGMRHPSNLYTLARSCFRCHITDDEEVVNVAGHPTRSQQFNMVSWSQGSMRHNFFRTGGRQNAFSDPERLRTMYVISVLTDLEFSLRAASKSTVRGNYATTHAKHCREVQQELAQICERIPDPRLKEALQAIQAVRFSLQNAPAFAETAKVISRIAWDFSVNPGSELEAIADLLPPPNAYRGISER